MLRALIYSTVLTAATISACPGLEHEIVPAKVGIEFGLAKRQNVSTAATSCTKYDYARLGKDWAVNCPTEWGLCKNGTMQSPIDLPNNTFAGTWEPRFAFPGGIYISGSISNSGYGPKWTPDECAVVPTLTFDNRTMQLLQFHLHTPKSEHTFGGQYLRSEMHFVFAEGGKPAAVVGIGLETGPEGPFWADIFEQIDAQGTQLPPISSLGVKIPVSLNFQKVLNDKYLGNYWTYRGSLTTPTCTQGLRWFVAGNFKTLDPVQFGRIERVSKDSDREIFATTPDHRLNL